MFIFVTSCKTDEPNNAGTVKDKDGNTYHTVKIGTQIWMVENMKTTKYNDGTAIPEVIDNATWQFLKTGAYCNYNNDASNGIQYGKLYNWYAVNTGKLAPKGWHIPTDAEWTILDNYVNSTSSNVAKALAATINWSSNTGTGTIGNDLTKNNSSGFTALPGGCRSHNGGIFEDIGDAGSWWSTTELSISIAWSRNLFSTKDYLDHATYYKNRGYSVRCVKD